MHGATVWTSDIWTSGAVLGGEPLTPAVGGVAAGAREQGCLRLSGPPDSCVWGECFPSRRLVRLGTPHERGMGPKGAPSERQQQTQVGS